MEKVQMMIRFLVFSLVSVCLGVCYAVQPPNIILCMGDDHGGDETAYNGHPYLIAPPVVCFGRNVLGVIDHLNLRGRFFIHLKICLPHSSEYKA